jgi:hypothetical protein
MQNEKPFLFTAQKTIYNHFYKLIFQTRDSGSFGLTNVKRFLQASGQAPSTSFSLSQLRELVPVLRVRRLLVTGACVNPSLRGCV